MTFTLCHGDCLEEMARIDAGSVDAIIADLPYGTTACKWDSVIPLEPLWAHFKRVLKQRGAVVLFGAQPFTTALISSNFEWFKYCWYWEKSKGANVALVNYQPLRVIEEVVVFSDGASSYTAAGNDMTYNPQMEELEKPYTRVFETNKCYRESHVTSPLRSKRPKQKKYTHRHPRNLVSESNVSRNKRHPTQKPVALLEYLVRTYTNEGETVLDCTMGSGTTGVACMNTGRNFIGIELEREYYDIAAQRIEKAANAARQLELL